MLLCECCLLRVSSTLQIQDCVRLHCIRFAASPVHQIEDGDMSAFSSAMVSDNYGLEHPGEMQSHVGSGGLSVLTLLKAVRLSGNSKKTVLDILSRHPQLLPRKTIISTISAKLFLL
ncbi:Phosphoglucosamine mutase [Frankliniella fusca]|uniref:Phosphoglucosamine mutase n=1 Tax=Frankliniella fusca TaxID=407009 RepID=A0AAE1I163_9NEOP|nr:Phosphoglucosamine mutase [Frankliniella fusca]KAK3931379.1 Phosphoglucosamine mutase [Frankliniella fusca]